MWAPARVTDLQALRGGTSDLDFGGGSGFGDLETTLTGKSIQSLRTMGDGACAVHAAFGEQVLGSNIVEHAGPRFFLQEVFSAARSPDSMRALVRPEMEPLVTNIEQTLWTYFIVRHVQSDGNSKGQQRQKTTSSTRKQSRKPSQRRTRVQL